MFAIASHYRKAQPRTGELKAAVGSIVALVILTALLTGCKEPPIYCASGRGDFAVKYALAGGDEPCSTLLGDVVGMQSYSQVKDELPDFGDASVGFQAARLGDFWVHALEQGLGDANADHRTYSLGDFAGSFPDEDGFCSIPETSLAEQDLPEVPEIPAVEDDPTTPDEDESIPAVPVQPAISLSYAWRDVRFFVTPDSQGTQFTADLTYTENECSAEYRAVGVFPAVPCMTDDECNDEANGMNPSFAVHCDPDLLLCVLNEDPPSFE